MNDMLRERFHSLYRSVKRFKRRNVRRARRFERRKFKLFRAWIENTQNLIHLSIVLFVPLLIGVVTLISNTVSQLSFLLFPPLASGTYTLFANPTGRFASPKRFVAGLTTGAVCGWIALEVGVLIHGMSVGALRIDAAGAALSVLLTGVVTWSFDIEEPAAFSTALLVLVTKTSQLAYVTSIVVSSVLVASVFVVWKQRFFRQRSRYLYRTTTEESRVLVPVRENHQRSTSLLAGRLVGGDDPGEVVLLDIVDDAAIAERERDIYERTRENSDAPSPSAARRMTPTQLATQRACEEAVARLEAEADHITSRLDIPCEVIVAAGENPATTVLETARDADCDLIVTAYEEQDGSLSPFITELFTGDTDAVIHRAVEGRSRWERVLAPVRHGGNLANRMIEFATTLVGSWGQVSVCHCIESEAERNRAESMLSYLIEPFSGDVETRIPRSSIEDFLGTVAPQYDLVMLGASTDRSVASRFITPPTFESIGHIDCDLALVHRG